ncbi:MAG TPA: C4-type zinc ribbon domain-containing protein [Rugosimonospora sp.]|nr:C4-type zinc ribbon domain-containing protein [Rugosimonospora sp.]
MRMDAQIQRLVHLQALDTRLAELRNRLQAIPAQLAAVDARVSNTRQQIAAAKEALTTSLKDRKKYEMDVDSWKEKARKYRDQSFEVKTNEAYKALQHEIQHAETQVAQAEDRLLERMVAGEEYERQVKTAEGSVGIVESEAQAERQKIQAEQSSLQQELQTKEAERREIASEIPEELLSTYEHIAGRRHGIGLAEVRDQACSLCGVRIRPHVFQELRRSDSHEIFQCESCTRILYYVEPPVAAPPDAESKASAAGISANEP